MMCRVVVDTLFCGRCGGRPAQKGLELQQLQPVAFRFIRHLFNQIPLGSLVDIRPVYPSFRSKQKLGSYPKLVQLCCLLPFVW